MHQLFFECDRFYVSLLFQPHCTRNKMKLLRLLCSSAPTSRYPANTPSDFSADFSSIFNVRGIRLTSFYYGVKNIFLQPANYPIEELLLKDDFYLAPQKRNEVISVNDNAELASTPNNSIVIRARWAPQPILLCKKDDWNTWVRQNFPATTYLDFKLFFETITAHVKNLFSSISWNDIIASDTYQALIIINNHIVNPWLSLCKKNIYVVVEYDQTHLKAFTYDAVQSSTFTYDVYDTDIFTYVVYDIVAQDVPTGGFSPLSYFTYDKVPLTYDQYDTKKVTVTLSDITPLTYDLVKTSSLSYDDYTSEKKTYTIYDHAITKYNSLNEIKNYKICGASTADVVVMNYMVESGAKLPDTAEGPLSLTLACSLVAPSVATRFSSAVFVPVAAFHSVNDMMNYYEEVSTKPVAIDDVTLASGRVVAKAEDFVAMAAGNNNVFFQKLIDQLIGNFTETIDVDDFLTFVRGFFTLSWNSRTQPGDDVLKIPQNWTGQIFSSPDQVSWVYTASDKPKYTAAITGERYLSAPQQYYRARSPFVITPVYLYPSPGPDPLMNSGGNGNRWAHLLNQSQTEPDNRSDIFMEMLLLDMKTQTDLYIPTCYTMQAENVSALGGCRPFDTFVTNLRTFNVHYIDLFYIQIYVNKDAPIVVPIPLKLSANTRSFDGGGSDYALIYRNRGFNPEYSLIGANQAYDFKASTIDAKFYIALTLDVDSFSAALKGHFSTAISSYLKSISKTYFTTVVESTPLLYCKWTGKSVYYLDSEKELVTPDAKDVDEITAMREERPEIILSHSPQTVEQVVGRDPQNINQSTNVHDVTYDTVVSTTSHTVTLIENEVSHDTTQVQDPKMLHLQVVTSETTRSVPRVVSKTPTSLEKVVARVPTTLDVFDFNELKSITTSTKSLQITNITLNSVNVFYDNLNFFPQSILYSSNMPFVKDVALQWNNFASFEPESTFATSQLSAAPACDFDIGALYDQWLKIYPSTTPDVFLDVPMFTGIIELLNTGSVNYISSSTSGAALYVGKTPALNVTTIASRTDPFFYVMQENSDPGWLYLQAKELQTLVFKIRTLDNLQNSLLLSSPVPVTLYFEVLTT